MQVARPGEKTMSKEIGYADWDVVVQACEKEFGLIDKTRISMDVAEKCQRVTYTLAKLERDKFPKPKEEKKKPEGVN